MQVVLWVFAFTVIYAIVTLAALAANTEYKGPKIPNALGLLIMIVLYFISLPTVIDAAKGGGDTNPGPSIVDYPAASTNGGGGSTHSSANENTEDKLRRVYDSQGVQYDDQMIRQDARAIEQLHREFGR